MHPAAGIVAGETVAMYVVAAYMALGISPAPCPAAMRCLTAGYADDWQVTVLGKRAALWKAGEVFPQYLARVEGLGLKVTAGSWQ